MQARFLLNKYINKLKIKKSTISYSNGGSLNFYSYGGTPEAIKSLNLYFNEYKKLRLNLYKNSIGDGFILGVLASIINKASVKSERNKLIALIGLMLSTAFTCYDNKQREPLWFFDGEELKVSENLFSNTNIHTFGRIGATTLTFLFSFLGTNYCFEKKEQIAQSDKSNWIEKTKAKLNEFKSHSQDKFALFKNKIQEKVNISKKLINSIYEKKALKIATYTAISAGLTLATVIFLKKWNNTPGTNFVSKADDVD